MPNRRLVVGLFLAGLLSITATPTRALIDIPVSGATVAKALQDALEAERAAVERLAGAEVFEFGGLVSGAIGGTGVLTTGVEVFVALEGVIDLEEERKRLTGSIERARGQLAAATGKLANAKFVERAPAEVVEKERAKATRYTEEIGTLERQLEQLGGAGA